MNRLSPIHWLGVVVGAMVLALLMFNDNGSFPVYKPKLVAAHVEPLKADSQVLERFSADLRQLWDKDQQAYANYRSGAATALKRRDPKVFALSVAEWDSSLRAIEDELQDVKVSPTANGKLKDLLDGSAKEFAGALARERRIAQSVLVMMANKLDISSEIATEMKEANLASVRSALALHSAYQLLGMEPQPTPQH